MNSFSNVCQQWTDEEEALLLEELNTNNDIETIAKKHGRTEGGITPTGKKNSLQNVFEKPFYGRNYQTNKIR